MDNQGFNNGDSGMFDQQNQQQFNSPQGQQFGFESQHQHQQQSRPVTPPQSFEPMTADSLLKAQNDQTTTQSQQHQQHHEQQHQHNTDNNELLSEMDIHNLLTTISQIDPNTLNNPHNAKLVKMHDQIKILGNQLLMLSNENRSLKVENQSHSANLQHLSDTATQYAELYNNLYSEYQKLAEQQTNTTTNNNNVNPELSQTHTSTPQFAGFTTIDELLSLSQQLDQYRDYFAQNLPPQGENNPENNENQPTSPESTIVMMLDSFKSALATIGQNTTDQVNSYYNDMTQQRQQLEQFQQQITTQTQELEQIKTKKDVENTNNVATNVQNDMNELMTQLRQENEQLKQVMNDYSEENASLKQESEILIQEMAILAQENETKIATLTKDKDGLVAENAQLVQENTTLMSEKIQLGQEIEQLRLQNAQSGQNNELVGQLQSQITELIEKNNTLQESENSLLQENVSLEHRNGQLLQENETFIAQNTQLLQDMANVTTERDQLQQNETTLRQEITQLTQTINNTPALPVVDQNNTNQDNDTTNNNNDLNAVKEELAQALELYQYTAQTYQELKTESDEQILMLEGLLVKNAENYSALESTQRQILAENIQLKTQYEQVHNENIQLQLKIDSLTTECNELQGIINDNGIKTTGKRTRAGVSVIDQNEGNVDFGEMFNDNNNTTTQNTDLLTQLTQQTQQLTDLESQLTQKSIELEQKSTTLVQLQQHNDQLLSDIAQLRTQNETTEKSLQTAQSDNITLRNTITTLSLQLSEQIDLVLATQSKLDAAVAVNNTTNNTSVQTTNLEQNNETNTNTTQQDENIDEIKAQYELLSLQLESFREQHNELVTYSDAQTSHIEALQAQNNELIERLAIQCVSNEQNTQAAVDDDSNTVSDQTTSQVPQTSQDNVDDTHNNNTNNQPSKSQPTFSAPTFAAPTFTAPTFGSQQPQSQSDTAILDTNNLDFDQFGFGDDNSPNNNNNNINMTIDGDDSVNVNDAINTTIMSTSSSQIDTSSMVDQSFVNYWDTMDNDDNGVLDSTHPTPAKPKIDNINPNITTNGQNNENSNDQFNQFDRNIESFSFGDDNNVTNHITNHTDPVVESVDLSNYIGLDQYNALLAQKDEVVAQNQQLIAEKDAIVTENQHLLAQNTENLNVKQQLEAELEQIKLANVERVQEETTANIADDVNLGVPVDQANVIDPTIDDENNTNTTNTNEELQSQLILAHQQSQQYQEQYQTLFETAQQYQQQLEQYQQQCEQLSQYQQFHENFEQYQQQIAQLDQYQQQYAQLLEQCEQYQQRIVEYEGQIEQLQNNITNNISNITTNDDINNNIDDNITLDNNTINNDIDINAFGFGDVEMPTAINETKPDETVNVDTTNNDNTNSNTNNNEDDSFGFFSTSPTTQQGTNQNDDINTNTNEFNNFDTNHGTDFSGFGSDNTNFNNFGDDNTDFTNFGAEINNDSNNSITMNAINTVNNTDELQAQIITLEGKLSDSQQHCASLQNECQQYQQQITTLQEQSVQSQQSNTQQNDDATTNNNDECAQCEQYQDQLSGLYGQCEQYQQQITTLGEQCQEYHAQAAQFSDQYNNLLQLHTQNEQRIAELEANRTTAIGNDQDNVPNQIQEEEQQQQQQQQQQQEDVQTEPTQDSEDLLLQNQQLHANIVEIHDMYNTLYQQSTDIQAQYAQLEAEYQRVVALQGENGHNIDDNQNNDSKEQVAHDDTNINSITSVTNCTNCESLAAQNTSVVAQYDELLSLATQYTDRISEYETLFAQYQEQLSQLASYEEKCQQFDQVNNENITVKEQLTKLQNEYNIIVAEKARLESEKDNFTLQMVTLQGQIDTLIGQSGQVTELSTQNTTLQAQVDQITQEKTLLEAQLEETNAQYQSLYTDATQQQSQFGEIIEQNNELRTQLEQLHNSNFELTTQITTLNNEKDQLTTQIATLQQQNNDLTLQINANNTTADQIGQYEATIAANTAQIAQLESQINTITSQLENKTQEFDNVSSKLLHLESNSVTIEEHNQLRTQCDANIEQYNQLMEQFNTIFQAHEEISAQLPERNQQFESLQGEYNTLVSEYDTQREQLSKALEVINDLEGKLNQNNQNNQNNNTSNQNNTLKLSPSKAAHYTVTRQEKSQQPPKNNINNNDPKPEDFGFSLDFGSDSPNITQDNINTNSNIQFNQSTAQFNVPTFTTAVNNNNNNNNYQNQDSQFDQNNDDLNDIFNNFGDNDNMSTAPPQSTISTMTTTPTLQVQYQQSPTGVNVTVTKNNNTVQNSVPANNGNFNTTIDQIDANTTADDFNSYFGDNNNTDATNNNNTSNRSDNKIEDSVDQQAIIAQLQSQLDEKNNAIIQLQQQIDEKNAQNTSGEDNAHKDSDNQTDIAQLQAQIDSYEEQINHYQAHIEQINTQYSELLNQAQEQQDLFNTVQAEVDELKKKQANIDENLQRSGDVSAINTQEPTTSNQNDQFGGDFDGGFEDIFGVESKPQTQPVENVDQNQQSQDSSSPSLEKPTVGNEYPDVDVPDLIEQYNTAVQTITELREQYENVQAHYNELNTRLGNAEEQYTQLKTHNEAVEQQYGELKTHYDAALENVNILTQQVEAKDQTDQENVDMDKPTNEDGTCNQCVETQAQLNQINELYQSTVQQYETLYTNATQQQEQYVLLQEEMQKLNEEVVELRQNNPSNNNFSNNDSNNSFVPNITSTKSAPTSTFISKNDDRNDATGADDDNGFDSFFGEDDNNKNNNNNNNNDKQEDTSSQNNQNDDYNAFGDFFPSYSVETKPTNEKVTEESQEQLQDATNSEVVIDTLSNNNDLDHDNNVAIDDSKPITDDLSPQASTPDSNNVCLSQLPQGYAYAILQPGQIVVDQASVQGLYEFAHNVAQGYNELQPAIENFKQNCNVNITKDVHVESQQNGTDGVDNTNISEENVQEITQDDASIEEIPENCSCALLPKDCFTCYRRQARGDLTQFEQFFRDIIIRNQLIGECQEYLQVAINSALEQSAQNDSSGGDEVPQFDENGQIIQKMPQLDSFTIQVIYGFIADFINTMNQGSNDHEQLNNKMAEISASFTHHIASVGGAFFCPVHHTVMSSHPQLYYNSDEQDAALGEDVLSLQRLQRHEALERGEKYRHMGKSDQKVIAQKQKLNNDGAEQINNDNKIDDLYQRFVQYLALAQTMPTIQPIMNVDTANDMNKMILDGLGIDNVENAIQVGPTQQQKGDLLDGSSLDPQNKITVADYDELSQNYQQVKAAHDSLQHQLELVGKDPSQPTSDACPKADNDSNIVPGENASTNGENGGVNQFVYQATVLELSLHKQLTAIYKSLLSDLRQHTLNNQQSLLSLPIILDKLTQNTKSVMVQGGSNNGSNHDNIDVGTLAQQFNALKEEAEMLQEAYVEVYDQYKKQFDEKEALLEAENQRKLAEDKEKQLQKQQLEEEKRKKEEEEAKKKGGAGWFGFGKKPAKNHQKHDVLAPGAYNNEFKYDPATGRYVFEDNDGEEEEVDTNELPPAVNVGVQKIDLIDFSKYNNQNYTNVSSSSPSSSSNTIVTASFNDNALIQFGQQIVQADTYVQQLPLEYTQYLNTVLAVTLPDKHQIYSTIAPAEAPVEGNEQGDVDAGNSIVTHNKIIASVATDEELIAQLHSSAVFELYVQSAQSGIQNAQNNLDNVENAQIVALLCPQPQNDITGMIGTIDIKNIDLINITVQNGTNGEDVSNISLATTITPTNNYNANNSNVSAISRPSGSDNTPQSTSQNDTNGPPFKPIAKKSNKPKVESFDDLYADIGSLTGTGDVPTSQPLRGGRKNGSNEQNNPPSTTRSKRIVNAFSPPPTEDDDDMTTFGDNITSPTASTNVDSVTEDISTPVPLPIVELDTPNNAQDSTETVSSEEYQRQLAEIAAKDAQINELTQQYQTLYDQAQAQYQQLEQQQAQLLSQQTQLDQLSANTPAVDKEQSTDEATEVAAPTTRSDEETNALIAQYTNHIASLEQQYNDNCTQQQATIEHYTALLQQYSDRVGQFETGLYATIESLLKQSNTILEQYCTTNNIEFDSDEKYQEFVQNTVPGQINSLQQELSNTTVQLAQYQSQYGTLTQELFELQEKLTQASQCTKDNKADDNEGKTETDASTTDKNATGSDQEGDEKYQQLMQHYTQLESNYQQSLDYISQMQQYNEQQTATMQQYDQKFTEMQTQLVALQQREGRDEAKGDGSDETSHSNNDEKSLQWQLDQVSKEKRSLQAQLVELQRSLDQLQQLQSSHGNRIITAVDDVNNNNSIDENGAVLSHRRHNGRTGKPSISLSSSSTGSSASQYQRLLEEGNLPRQYNLDTDLGGDSDDENDDLTKRTHQLSLLHNNNINTINHPNHDPTLQEQHQTLIQTAIPLLQSTIFELLERCKLAEQQLTILQAQGVDISTILMSCGYSPATGGLLNGTASNNGQLVNVSSPNNKSPNVGTQLVHIDPQSGDVIPTVLENIAKSGKGYAMVPVHNQNELNVVIACSKMFLTTFAGILASVVVGAVAAQGGL